ncbi:MAG: hypothetical protein BWK80_04740 [Desulfobacteraceae bacterium IS3]|nr:MAG: hypothetical protein BWK80_04740 [Desulfobacteraceae bacterium IS3]
MGVTVNIGRKNMKYYASINGVEFYVGTKVSYESNWGLSNFSIKSGECYNPDIYRDQYGFWCDFIYPITQCESKGYFNCLNTYDRACFTFGFLQYAAHVPNGDFIKYFRRLLATPEGKDYFSDLILNNGRICKITDNGIKIIDSDTSTDELMKYLNPSLDEVEDIEVINSAKFVHWCNNIPSHREIQVECGITHIRNAMKNYAERYNLNGVIDKVCLVVADIRHQGRGKSSEILHALNTGKDYNEVYNNLLKIGVHEYESRIKTLKDTIANLVSEKRLEKMKYDINSRDFVPFSN